MLTGFSALGRTAPANVGLDGEQSGDPFQHLARGGRARLDVHVVDLASGVGPTGDFGQAGNAGLRIGCVEIGEARIAVGMQEAATAGEQRARVLGLAVGRVAIEAAGGGVAPERALIAHHGPQPAGLGLAFAGIEHRNRRVVGVQREAGANMALDPRAQGFEQSGETADPARHDRTVDFNAAAGVDVGLTMQRQMIAELRHDDMGEQRWTRTPLLDRQRRHWRLDDGLARPAAHLRPHVHDALEVGGNVFEHLALVRADPAELVAAAGRAHARRVVDDPLRRQMIGQAEHGSKACASSSTRRRFRSPRPRPTPRRRRARASRRRPLRYRRSAARAARLAHRASPTCGRSGRDEERRVGRAASRSSARWREPRP